MTGSPGVAADPTQELRRLVVGGSYEPGDRLPPERELAQRFGVSRPALREAIRSLVTSGLLEARRGSGTYVAPIHLPDLFAVRLRLEPLAAELAASRCTRAQGRRLAVLRERLASALDDAPEFALRDRELHAELAAAAGSRLLNELLGRLADLTIASRALSARLLEARRSTVRDLGELVDAIAARDPAQAGKAMERHIAAMQDHAIPSQPRYESPDSQPLP